MARKERTSSKKFIEEYDKIWEEGPIVKYNFPDCRPSERDLLSPFESRKSESDETGQLKIKAKVNGLSKKFNLSPKLEVSIEVVKALAEIGSVDALIALHGFSNIPTDSLLHDEINKQLSHAIDSYMQSQRGRVLVFKRILLKNQF